MLLNVVLERLHSEFMIQQVCDGKALRNKLGDSDSQRKTSGLDLNKVQNYLRWRRCHLQRDQNLDSKLNLLIKWRKEIFSFRKYLNDTMQTNSQITFCPAHRKRAKAVKISLVSLVRVQPLTAPDVIKLNKRDILGGLSSSRFTPGEKWTFHVQINISSQYIELMV